MLICLLHNGNFIQMQKYLVGTLFEEEEQSKKTNFQNMKAKDPNGNVRWKGAFTGGFQAGFKNTCGSKQGWAPATFVSSIVKRAEKVEQNVFQYMDKDDIGSENITKNISLKNDFANGSKNSLNIQLVQSIGEKIYDKLKRQEAFNNAPQNIEDLHMLLQKYAKQQELGNELNYNYYLKDLQFHHSVGDNAVQFQDDDFLANYEDFFKKVIRDRTKEQTEEEIAKRREENKVYFDYTKPLEEEPEYLKEIQEIQLQSAPKKRRKNIINEQSLKHLFGRPIKTKQFSKINQITMAPQDYDPYHRLRNMLIKEKQEMELYNKKYQEKKPKIHSIQKRSDLLGQTRLSDKFKASESINSTEFVRKGQEREENKKFFQDQNKNQRYIDFVMELEGKKISARLEYLGWEQAERQRQQFEQLYQLQHSKKVQLPENVEKALVSKKGKNSKEIIVRRVVSEWFPEKILCKRFNVLVPHH